MGSRRCSLWVVLVPATLVVSGAAAARPAGPDSKQPTADSLRSRALHVLNRLTFGPRSGEVDRVLAMGVERFIEAQLNPGRIADADVERRLERLTVLNRSPRELAEMFAEDRRDRQERQRAMADSMRPGPQPGGPPRTRRMAAELQQAAVLRATLSERQLYEVMVDFWTNHFNVFMAKGADRFLMASYIQETIRPHALGTFEDLLIATAKSPAMLFYLDNVQSVAPGSEPPQLRRPRMAGRQMRPLPERLRQRMPRGLNENYARELLELHTLGVDGGYTQEDVVNVARILTGWSIEQPQRGTRFAFHDWAHDRGEKTVLGTTFPAGQGMSEGVELLEMLARHPSTMRHVGSKLCARFVNDDPPSGCVDAAVHAWEASGGEIRAVLRAMFASPEFWAAENRAAKTKTPLEFVASAVRAVGAIPDTTPALAQLVARLGQPLYLQEPPTGYPETQESWVNSGALLQRVNTAMAIAAGRAPGLTIDLDLMLPAGNDPEALVGAVNRSVLNGGGSAATLKVIRDQVSAVGGREARVLAVGLALGSPEFQRQ